MQDSDSLCAHTLSLGPLSQLTAVPDGVCGLPRLATLLLGHNRLAALPRDLGRLQQTIHALDVSHNFLTALPESLSQLGGLVSLLAAHNALAALPALGGMTRLATVDLRENDLLAPGLAPGHGATGSRANDHHRQYCQHVGGGGGGGDGGGGGGGGGPLCLALAPATQQLFLSFNRGTVSLAPGAPRPLASLFGDFDAAAVSRLAEVHLSSCGLVELPPDLGAWRLCRPRKPFRAPSFSLRLCPSSCACPVGFHPSCRRLPGEAVLPRRERQRPARPRARPRVVARTAEAPGEVVVSSGRSGERTGGLWKHSCTMQML